MAAEERLWLRPGVVAAAGRLGSRRFSFAGSIEWRRCCVELRRRLAAVVCDAAERRRLAGGGGAHGMWLSELAVDVEES